MNLKTLFGMACLNFGVAAVVSTVLFLFVRIFSLSFTVEECFECGAYVTLFVVYPWTFALVDGRKKVK